jgi:hypothetical protein
VGLLDDAIREHLDLKRRHGADPSEIERAEREALGPVRRAPEPAEEAAIDDDLGRGPAVAYDHAGDEDWDEAYFDEAPDHEPSTLDETRIAADPAATEPSPEPEPPQPRQSSGQETAEYEVPFEDERRGGEDEDMLEETPEFLQDAPDHDRLWFEQKPPRDFDFDG